MILNQTAYLGRGAIDNIADEVTGRGFTKVLVVTDRGLVSAGIVDRVLAVLERVQLDYEIYDDVTPNPTNNRRRNHCWHRCRGDHKLCDHRCGEQAQVRLR